MCDMVIDNYNEDFEDYKILRKKQKVLDFSKKMLYTNGYVDTREIEKATKIPSYMSQVWLLEDGYFHVHENIYKKKIDKNMWEKYKK